MAYSVASINCLVVVGRVPVWIKDDGSVCAGQIQTKSTDLGCKETAEDRFVFVEIFAKLFTASDLGVTVDSKVLEILLQLRLVLDNVLDEIQHLF